MRSPRPPRSHIVLCRLEEATVTVDYGHGRARASLAPPPPGHKVLPGPVWQPSWGSLELDYGYRPLTRPRLPHLLSAALGLSAVGGLLRMGHRSRAMVRVLWFLRTVRRIPGRAASLAEAEALCLAVRWIGLFLPARIACLEESVGAVLALALHGRHVIWCHGVSGDPIEFHAWLRTWDGALVAQPASTSRFHTLLTVPHTMTTEEWIPHD